MATYWYILQSVLPAAFSGGDGSVQQTTALLAALKFKKTVVCTAQTRSLYSYATGCQARLVVCNSIAVKNAIINRQRLVG